MAKRVAKRAAAVRKPVKRAPVAKKAAAKKVKTRVLSKAKASRVAEAAQPLEAKELAHSLNTLLHTMQTVQNYEERLCSLKHALQRGRANGTLLRELREVLDELPAHDYLHEVDALRRAIAA